MNMNNHKKNPYNTLRPRTRPYVIPRTPTETEGFKPTKSARIMKRTAHPVSEQVKHNRRGGI